MTLKENAAEIIGAKYPEVLYFASRETQIGGQPVFRRLLPDGERQQLNPEPSQKLRFHSPDGFQWGYCGSGPAQLALALLLHATTSPGEAQRYYQQFKEDKVAGWQDVWAILRSEILHWILDQKKAELTAMVAQRQN